MTKEKGNCNVMWFNKEKNDFLGFRVFAFALYPKSKTKKSRKFFFYFNFWYYVKIKI